MKRQTRLTVYHNRSGVIVWLGNFSKGEVKRLENAVWIKRSCPSNRRPASVNANGSVFETGTFGLMYFSTGTVICPSQVLSEAFSGPLQHRWLDAFCVPCSIPQRQISSKAHAVVERKVTISNAEMIRRIM